MYVQTSRFANICAQTKPICVILSHLKYRDPQRQVCENLNK